MEERPHNILRHSFDVAFRGSEPEGIELHRTLPELLARRVVPAIEEVLDRCASPEVRLMIERIDIDAGTVSFGRLEEELPSLIATALDRTLNAMPVVQAWNAPPLPADGPESGEPLNDAPGAIGGTPPLDIFRRAESAPSTQAEQGDALRRSLPAGSGSAPIEAVQARLHLDTLEDVPRAGLSARTGRSNDILPDRHAARLGTEAVTTTEALRFFLEHGTLPWSFDIGTGESFERRIVASWELASPELLLRAGALLRSALSGTTARKRLVRQFTPPFIESLLTIMARPGSDQALQRIFTMIREREIPGDAGHVGDTARAFPESVRERVERLVRHIAEGEDVDTFALRPHVAAPQAYGTSDSGTVEAMTTGKEVSGEPATIGSADSELPSSTNREFRSEPEADGEARHDTVRSMPAPPDVETMPGHPDAISGIPVGNAGLVLFHPFLPQCFRALGIADDDRLLVPGRALPLLHFLATGRERGAEYEVVLPKLLCGVPPGFLSEAPQDLSPEEKDEALAVLSAVTKHWDALKDTGPDALRDAFVRRDGMLTRRDDGDWLLRVESSGFDILLDRLPWGISMIRLPWMRFMLRVEWHY